MFPGWAASTRDTPAQLLARGDRVDVRQLWLIAVVCLAVGITLSSTARRFHHGERSPEPPAQRWQSAGLLAPASETTARDTLPAAPRAAASSSWTATKHDTPKTGAHTPPVASAARSASTSPGHRADPRSGIAQNLASTLKLEREHVRYRCPSDSACPHDRALETRVWQLLARIPSCRGVNAPIEHTAELVLHFTKGRVVHTTLSSREIPQSLNLRAVRKCVDQSLTRLRSSRGLDSLELHFGFRMVPGK
jgi:hypothetical protein